MNGFSKIEKWLKEKGYYMDFNESQMYKHCDSFHKNDYFWLDVYSTSNGYYIKCKIDGRPRYYLCENKTSLTPCLIIDFSQSHFIKRLEKYFPAKEE